MSHLSEIVIGIDFGTTYSGVTWAINSGSNAEVSLINKWRNSPTGSPETSKVPSVISYDQNSQPKSWGFDAMRDSNCFRWIKILARTRSSYASGADEVQRAQALLKQLGKSPKDVIGDYLKLLWDEIDETITSKGFSSDNFQRRIILTVPAIWDPKEQEDLKRTAIKSGMPDNIQMTTEPEAAAHRVFKEREADGLLNIGDTFVICDAGGGTVDLISYTVIELKPLRIREAVVGSGGLCGSTKLDVAFQQRIVTLIGQKQWEGIQLKNRTRMMTGDFERIKRKFSERGPEDWPVELIGVEDDEENGIQDDTIILKKDLLRTVFNDVMAEIFGLVDNQIKAAQAKELDIKAVILVGGFGESAYLLNYLTQSLKGREIAVYQGKDCWTSVCRGATLWGLERTSDHEVLQNGAPAENSTTVTARIARHSYGVSVTPDWENGVHLAEDKWYDSKDGKTKAKNQVKWLLTKGEPVKEGRVLTHDIYQTISGVRWFSRGVFFGRDSHSELTFSITLFYCAADKPPSRRTQGVVELGPVNYTVDKGYVWLMEDKVKGGNGTYRKAPLQLSMMLGTASFDFDITYQGDKVGTAKLEYVDG